MPRTLTPRSTLEALRKEAKRWLAALREGDASARKRFADAHPAAPPNPTLRDVQHALALEYGFSGWIALRAAVSAIASERGDAGQADARAAALGRLLDAAGTGDLGSATAVLDAYPDIVSLRGLRPGHSGHRTALHHAVGGRHGAMVALLLDRGADPNVRDEGDNAMPIHFAAEHGDLEIVKLLVEHGSDVVGAGDHHELEAIGWATCFSNLNRDVAEYLLEHGARQTIFSATALGDIDAIRSIVASRPADLERPMDRTNHRRHPLHLAVLRERLDSLDVLLDLGANTEAVDAGELTALDRAALTGEMAIAERLLERGARLTLPSAIALDRDVDRLLKENTEALRPEGRWSTLIVRAAERAPGRVVEALIRYGASVNAVDSEATSVDGTHGYTPLHAAAFHGNLDVVRVLLAHGASVTARETKYCGTPAGWAAYAGHVAARDLILEGPIDMFDAIAFGRVERLRGIFDRDAAALNRRMGWYLLRQPAQGEWTESWWTPLAFAVVTDNAAAVRELLDLGADAEVRNPDGRSLRTIAAARGAQEIVALLDAYAPPRDESRDDRAALVARFLTNACPDHHVRGAPAHQVARHTAARLLRRHPDLARDNIYTAVACGEIDRVREILADSPDAASERGGPKGSAGAQGGSFVVDATTAAHPVWEPLLYTCFARLDHAATNDNAVAIARLLLDHGADPNAYFMAGDSRYSPLTGVIGEGEEGRPPHPRRDELTRLLLDRGANPYDVQVFYNMHFHGEVLWYLKLIHEHTVTTGRAADWDDPHWPMIDEGGYGLGARYLFTIAIEHNDLELAEWMLTRGADPNATLPSRSGISHRSLHETALRRGHLELADLLVRFGATPSGYEPSAEERFIAACLGLDRGEAERLAANHPEFVRSPRALFAATERDNVEAVRLLLELGTPIEAENDEKWRAMHVAAWSDSAGVAEFLVERGAAIDPVESTWGNSPLDFARYAGHQRMIDLLAPHSRDLWSLAFAGKIERLRALLRAEPALARSVLPNGVTPLMRLPDDEVAAYEIAKVFVEHGADPHLRADDGRTAIDLAKARGLDATAELLQAPGGPI